MAELIGGMVCLDEDEAAALAFFLRLSSESQGSRQIADALLLLADQIQTQVGRDPFEARRFSISIEPRRTRQ
jgi:hypothetical protein